MDGASRSEVQVPQAEMPEVRGDEAKAPRVNRWLAVAVAVLSIAVIVLGVALIVGSGPGKVAPTRPAVAEPTATEPEGESEPGAPNVRAVGALANPLRATFDAADRALVRHVDGSIAAYRNGASEGRFRMGGHGFINGPGLYYRYDQAHGGMVEVRDAYEAVGAREIERTSPVVVLGETTGTAGWGSWTVAFSVRAGAEDQLWLQHWEAPWGHILMQMWVI